jgi:hypothetical protein
MSNERLLWDRARRNGSVLRLDAANVVIVAIFIPGKTTGFTFSRLECQREASRSASGAPESNAFRRVSVARWSNSFATLADYLTGCPPATAYPELIRTLMSPYCLSSS